MDVRACFSMLMNLVLALMFVQAPFMHVHEHESTEHHPHGFLHTRFPHHHELSASKSPAFQGLDPDDDAVFQEWFSTTQSELSIPVFIPAFIYTVAPVESTEPFFELIILSGHDPPRRSRTSPRSPPV